MEDETVPRVSFARLHEADVEEHSSVEGGTLVLVIKTNEEFHTKSYMYKVVSRTTMFITLYTIRN